MRSLSCRMILSLFRCMLLITFPIIAHSIIADYLHYLSIKAKTTSNCDTLIKFHQFKRKSSSKHISGHISLNINSVGQRSNDLSSRSPAMTIEYASHRAQNLSTVMSSMYNGSEMHLASTDTVIDFMTTSDQVYSHEHTVRSPGFHDSAYASLPAKIVFVIALSCILFIISICIIVLVVVLRWRQNRLRKTVLNIIYTPASVRMHRNSTQSLLGNDEVDDGTSDIQPYLRLHSYESYE